jgi:probable rRNA maturation factor
MKKKSPRRSEKALAKVAETAVVRRAQKMLDVLGLAGTELSVALVDDATIRALNRQYRKKDKPTDVLAFPQHDDAFAALFGTAPADHAEGASLLLGDVIISVETASRQAKAHDKSLLDEVTMLLAHGVLHLVGFDHRTDDQEREMDAYVQVLVAAAASRKPMRLRLVPV